MNTKHAITAIILLFLILAAPAATASLPPEALLDSSGNGRHLTEYGGMGASGAAGKYGVGVEFDGVDDGLDAYGATGAIIGDLTIFVAMRWDATNEFRLSLEKARFPSGTRAEADNENFALVVVENNRLRYLHEYGELGTDLQLQSGDNVVTAGFHTITLQRDSTLRTVTVKLDGAIVIDGVYAALESPTGGEDGYVQIGSDAVTDDSTTRFTQLDGAIHEIRIWESLVEPAVLDSLASTSDLTYAGQPVGGEYALYFFEHPCVNTYSAFLGPLAAPLFTVLIILAVISYLAVAATVKLRALGIPILGMMLLGPIAMPSVDAAHHCSIATGSAIVDVIAPIILGVSFILVILGVVFYAKRAVTG